MITPVRKRFLQGFGANVYGQLIVAVIQLVGVPVLLYAWGAQLYGEWLILFAIPSYLSLTDLGFSQSAANDMCARMVRGDQAGALAVFQSLLVLVFCVAAAGIVIVSAVLWLLPSGIWLHFSVLGNEQVRWVLWLLALEVFVRLTEGTSEAGFRAGGELGFHGVLYMTTGFAQCAGVWIVALLGYGPVMAAAIYLVVRCFATALVAAVMLRRHPWLRYGSTQAHMNELFRLMKPALANVSQPFAQALNIQGMVLVVGAVLGPLAVVVFATLRTLTRLALQGVRSVNYSMEPELAFAWGAQNKALLRKLYIYSVGYSFWLDLCVAVTLYFLGEWIVTFWTHGKVAVDKRLFDWLLLSTVVSAFWYGGFILRRALNRHLRAALCYLIASLVSVGVAAALMHITGRLADAGLALLLTDAIMTVYILTSTNRLVDVSFPQLVFEIFDLRALVRPLLAIFGHAR